MPYRWQNTITITPLLSPRLALGGQAADQGRGAAAGGQFRQAAGDVAAERVKLLMHQH
jgi:hypothetical protein